MSSLNSYSFLKKVGHGAYGEVYKAQDLQNKKLVAIKVVAERQNKPEIKTLIKNQATILTSIEHEHIVRVEKSMIRGNSWYLVIEFCEHGNLQDYLGSYGIMEESVVRTVAYSLGNVLKYLKGRKIAHRDIKLANLLIAEGGRIKLADLGFAKQLEGDELMRTFAGTKATMAPEIMQNSGEQYEIKCDIWSYGVILYQLLTGRNPFLQQGYVNYKAELKFKNTSPEARNFISQCLKINPQQRISASQIGNHPWFRNFQPKYIQVIPEQHYSFNPPQQFIEQILNQYDYSIARAIASFKTYYNKSVDSMKQNFLFSIEEIKGMKNVGTKWLSLLCVIINKKMEQLNTSIVRVQLPNQAFVIEKLDEQIIFRNKKIILSINNAVKPLNQAMSASIKSPDQQLIRDILQHLDNLDPHKQFQTYSRVWKLVGRVCKIIESQFKRYLIRFQYHQSLDPRMKKCIQEQKKMTKEQFEEINSKGMVGIKFQRKDVLVYEVESVRKERKGEVFEGLVISALKEMAMKF